MELTEIFSALIFFVFAILGVMHHVFFFLLERKLKKERSDFWDSLGPKNGLGLPEPAVYRNFFFKREGLPDEIYQEYKFLINGGVIAGHASTCTFIIYLIYVLSPSVYSSMVSLWYRIGF